MTNTVSKIVDFVEGRMLPAEFEAFFYDASDVGDLLVEIKDLPGYVDEVDAYQYVLKRNFKSPGDLLNIQAMMETLLQSLGVDFVASDIYAKFYDAILSAVPKWVDVENEYFLRFLDFKNPKSAAAYRKIIKEAVVRDFKYQSKPPKWMQSPVWPFSNGRPMKFVGQTQISDAHDESWRYEFLDEQTGEGCVVIQAA